MGATLPSESKRSLIEEIMKLFPKNDRKKIFLVVALNLSLGFLDLLGVATIGLLGAVSVTGVQSQEPNDRISSILTFLQLESITFQKQIAFLAIIAALLFIFRTVASIFITRKIFFFLSRRGALLTSELFAKLMSRSLVDVQARSTQETLYALTTGVRSITLIVLGSAVSFLSDASLAIVMLFGLFLIEPTTALLALLFFGTLGFALYKLTNVRAQQLGMLDSGLSILSNEKITEVLSTFRESFVRDRRSFYASEIKKIRMKLADVSAEAMFMPNIGKYVIESGMVLGAILIAGIQFAISDAVTAIATLSVFLAAGARIAPALMRIQHNLIQMKSAIGSAAPTLQLINSLDDVPQIPEREIQESVDTQHENFLGELSLEAVSFRYPSNANLALDDISLFIPKGQFLAIVGSSGAGKTTLVDVLLGVITSGTGSVQISKKDPATAIAMWPGAIAYVPQDVVICNGTIRENVALGYPQELVNDELVWESLNSAQLSSLVRSLPNMLDSQVGERGTKLSGGQRQRLGIARALYTKPKVLVLDEATSSLDGKSEFDISESIQELKGKVTLIVVAHRLSTIRNADRIIYMTEGKITGEGSFEVLRNSNPDFDSQAKLMGL
jgi:ABC-type multidrug transport system fused ATPase/permease subunit